MNPLLKETNDIFKNAVNKELPDLSEMADKLEKKADELLEKVRNETARFTRALDEFKTKYPNQFEWVNNDLQNKFPEV